MKNILMIILLVLSPVTLLAQGEIGSESVQSFSASASQITRHAFNIDRSSAVGATLTVGIRGDFGSSNEYVDIYVEGDFIGSFSGRAGDCQSSYQYQEFTLTAQDIAGYASDGVINIEVRNSSSVNSCRTGQRFHSVNIALDESAGAGFSDSGPGISLSLPGETSEETFSIDGGQSTFHKFSIDQTSGSSATLQLGIRGDFGASNENATVLIEGDTIGTFSGRSGDCQSRFQFADFSISASDLANYGADGVIDIEVRNSSTVNACNDEQRFHSVTLTLDAGGGNDPLPVSLLLTNRLDKPEIHAATDGDGINFDYVALINFPSNLNRGEDFLVHLNIHDAYEIKTFMPLEAASDVFQRDVYEIDKSFYFSLGHVAASQLIDFLFPVAGIGGNLYSVVVAAGTRVSEYNQAQSDFYNKTEGARDILLESPRAMNFVIWLKRRSTFSVPASFEPIAIDTYLIQ